MSTTITALADELSATREDILALVDQLITLDGHDKVVDPETRGEVTLTPEAAEVIARQLKENPPA